MVVRLTLAMLLFLTGIGTTLAMPARIIILRHGEKADKWDLCDIGQERADALVANYLGRGAAKSLFAPNEAPAAFLAITLHSLELASPAAMSWHQPVTLYSVLQQKDEDKNEALDRRTQEAAKGQPALAGQDRGDGVGAQAHCQQEVGKKLSWAGCNTPRASTSRSTLRCAADMAERHLRLFLDH